jgi:hypothetical protein
MNSNFRVFFTRFTQSIFAVASYCSKNNSIGKFVMFFFVYLQFFFLSILKTNKLINNSKHNTLVKTQISFHVYVILKYFSQRKNTIQTHELVDNL